MQRPEGPAAAAARVGTQGARRELRCCRPLHHGRHDDLCHCRAASGGAFGGRRNHRLGRQSDGRNNEERWKHRHRRAARDRRDLRPARNTSTGGSATGGDLDGAHGGTATSAGGSATGGTSAVGGATSTGGKASGGPPRAAPARAAPPRLPGATRPAARPSQEAAAPRRADRQVAAASPTIRRDRIPSHVLPAAASSSPAAMA